MSVFDDAFAHTVGLEGGYSNNPKDAGGPTKYGIIEDTARAYGFKGDMRNLDLATAKAIYKKGFWDTLRLDDVGDISPAVAIELFDTNVNIKAGQTAIFFQRALNCFNQEGKLYADIDADGKLGKATIDTFKAYMAKRGKLGESVMLRSLNAQQGEYYMQRCEKREANEEFVFGWYANRVSI